MDGVIEVQPINTGAIDTYRTMALQMNKAAEEIRIVNQPQYESAAETLKAIKGFAAELETARKKITTPLDAAKKAVMDLFRVPATALENAEAKVKGAMLTYANEQERIRREQEEKLRIQAEEKARKEREKLEERARKAAESGKSEKATALLEQAAEVVAVAPVISPRVEKVSGISTKTIWKARVRNVALVPREYMVVDESALNKVAQATKGSLAIPGVEFYSEQVMSAGR
jgi:hypothetical protein